LLPSRPGGWSFVVLREGYLAWVRHEGRFAILTAVGWGGDAWPTVGFEIDYQHFVVSRRAPTKVPAGNSAVDVEAQLVLGQVLAAFRACGLIGRGTPERVRYLFE
jgi:hypothetical protein